MEMDDSQVSSTGKCSPRKCSILSDDHSKVETTDSMDFLRKVQSIPVVQSVVKSAAQVHERGKERIWLYASGALLVKGSVEILVWAAGKSPLKQPVEFLDRAACRVLDRLEEKYPPVLEPADKVMQNIKECTRQKLQQKMEYLASTSLGQMLLSGTDNILASAEKSLRSNLPTAAHQVIAHVTVDSSEFRADGNESHDVTVQQREKSIITEAVSLVTVYLSSRVSVFQGFCCPGKDIVEGLLKFVQRSRHHICVLKLDGQKLQHFPSTTPEKALSPEAKEKIQQRKKATPRKRLHKPGSAVGWLLQNGRQVLGYLGLVEDRLVSITFTDKPLCGIPNKDIQDTEEKKRKRESEAEKTWVEELQNLDKYRSDSDPDYEPSDGESTDSLEYCSSDEEELHCQVTEDTTGPVTRHSGEEELHCQVTEDTTGPVTSHSNEEELHCQVTEDTTGPVTRHSSEEELHCQVTEDTTGPVTKSSWVSTDTAASAQTSVMTLT